MKQVTSRDMQNLLYNYAKAKRNFSTASMARVFPTLGYQTIIFFLFSCYLISLVFGESYGYAKTIDKKFFGLKEEKRSHFRVYWHDIYSGSNPTAMAIVQPQNNSSTMFGFLSMIDDPLTEGPELNSKLVGKAQGFYGSASQEENGLIVIMNFVFMEGKYNGSTLTILGRNKVFLPEREMPVIGGSGLFRFARGYVKARTIKFNQTNGEATVEYNIYVLHY